MVSLAAAAKPAMLLAIAGLALGAVGMLLWRAARRTRGAEGMLPHIDVAAYNDALLSP